MEGTANVVVYHNGEIIRNTHEGVRFACESSFSFVAPCTMMFAELQYSLCQSIESDILKRVSNILYRNPVIVFGSLIQFDIMPITDEANMQRMFHIHRQTQVQQPNIELYVEFENIDADEIQHDSDMEDDRVEVYKRMNSDSEEDFEATYEIGEEDENGDVGGEAVVENVVVSPGVSQSMDAPSFMRNLDVNVMHVPKFSEYVSIGVTDSEEGEFRIGMEFSSRKSIIAAIRSYTISRGVDYTIYKSEPQIFYAKCKTYGHRCDWLIQASLIWKKGCWEIRRYNGRHTCTMRTISQDRSKLDSDIVAEAIRPLVETDPSMKVKYIIAKVQSRFNYTISYQNAWLAKQKSIAKVFGGWEESYQALPLWFSAMVQKMPGSIVQIETRPPYNGSEEADGVRILHRVFWCFNPCYRAFRYCKPLVHVDSTHLYGKYKGVLLVAVAQDGNQNIVPIAFAIVEGKTADTWYFFLSNLRRHVVRRDSVGIISDRHESIRAAINRSNGDWKPPRAWWMFCIRHIGCDFLKAFKDPYLQKLVVNIGYSRTVDEYNINYKKLQERGEGYAQWCDNLELHQWVLAFDEGHRWGHMTTNLVECLNSMLEGVRNLPVLALVRATYYRLNQLFMRKSAEAHERKRAGFTYSEFATQRIEANMQRARNLVVQWFDRRNEVFEVREMPNEKVLVVDLARRVCDCGHFQVERLPCRHVIACCSNQRLDWQVYVNDVYKMSEICKVYRMKFVPLGNPETWPAYPGPTLVANPTLRRTSKTRPKLTCYLNEMDSREIRGPQICCLCDRQGHSYSRCPQHVGPSGVGESGGS